MISTAMTSTVQKSPRPRLSQPIHHASSSSSTRGPTPLFPGNTQPTVYAGSSSRTSPHPMSMNHSAHDATCATSIGVTAVRGRSKRGGAVEPTNVRAAQATNTPQMPQDQAIAHPPTASAAVTATIAQCFLARCSCIPRDRPGTTHAPPLIKGSDVEPELHHVAAHRAVRLVAGLQDHQVGIADEMDETRLFVYFGGTSVLIVEPLAEPVDSRWV